MTERSAADEQIMAAATADDDAGDDKGQAAEPKDGATLGKPKDDTLELGGPDAPELTDEQKAAEAEKKEKRGRPWSQRVDTLTARNHEKDRIIADLTAKLSGQPVNAPSLDEVMANEPKADDFEFGIGDPEYVEARQDWKLEVRDARGRQAGEKAAEESKTTAAHQEISTKISDGMASVEQAGVEKYEDFKAKINDAVEARGGEPLHPMVSIGIAVSPAGADIAYRLATDETAMAKIENLAKTNRNAAAIAFGELEGEYLDSDDDADLDLSDELDRDRMFGRERARRKAMTKAPVERKLTKATAPERQARGGTGQFEVGDDTEDFAAFEKKIMGKKG